MSELRAIRSGEIYNIIEYEDCYRTDDLYIIKVKVDNVIAEKDAVIVELQAKNKRLEEIKDKYSNCDEKAINNIAKCELKIRSLSRALFKACTNWARFEGALFADEHEAEKWRKMESKCLKKAEEYR